MLDKRYICDDRPRPMCPEVAAMTDEEAEAEYQRLIRNLPKYDKDEE